VSFTSERSETFPYPLKKVFDTVYDICEKFGWGIRESVPRAGHITAMVFMSTLSWGEEVSIDLNKVGDKKTNVHVTSKSSGSIFSPIKNRMNIRKLFKELERSLSTLSKQPGS